MKGPKSIAVAKNNYLVYTGDYVSDLAGDIYKVLPRGALQSLDNLETHFKDFGSLELTQFSVFKRMITYGLVTPNLLLNADDTLSSDLLDYLDSVYSDAIDRLSERMELYLSALRMSNENDDGEVIVIFNPHTDEDLAMFPLADYYSALVRAMQRANPMNLPGKLAIQLEKLVKENWGNVPHEEE